MIVYNKQFPKKSASFLDDLPHDVVRKIAFSAGCKISDLNETNCRDIESLSVSELKTLDDISWIMHFDYLTHLDISGTEVQDISPLSALNHLRVVYMNETKVKDITSMSSLRKLRHIDIRKTEIVNLEPLSKLLVEWIYADKTRVEKMPAGGFDSLGHISLENCPINDIGPIASCPEIRYLHIRNTKISTLKPLFSCSKLKELHVSINNVGSWEEIQELKQRLPELSIHII